jgi:predicted Rossmann fold nucleotide-binding protein DprA/Smf involved in DNA uptake
MAMLGNLAVLNGRTLALFCSSRCPGSLILQASDLAHALRDAGAAVIGGFHTPMERACLEILLGGAGPLIVCPARGIYRRVPVELRKPLTDGRLLLLSPFEETERRVTSELAAYRNRFVAALAESVLFIHVATGGRTEALAREVLGWGKPVDPTTFAAAPIIRLFAAIRCRRPCPRPVRRSRGGRSGLGTSADIRCRGFDRVGELARRPRS